ncbi:MAG: sigma-54 dependent transcriptional regulator [Deltaproteobacteria bacterium]
MTPGRILIVDDDAAIRDGSSQALVRQGHEVLQAATGREALSLLDRSEFDLVFLDLKLPDINGLDLLKTIRERDPLVQIVMITAYGTIQNAVEAMRLGANDFLSKPFAPDELRLVTDRVLRARRLTRENLFLREELRRKEGETVIIHGSKAMATLLEQADRAAPTDSTILITGESGTGKGLLARRIHERSTRRENPFVAVDCSTLVPTLFESELFGHVKGAFTGATTNKMGKFELASGGTLFLDEIGNVSLDLQAKLLKVVEEKVICRVGSTRQTKVDTRIIAATNQDLRQAAREGRFREDLYFRLNVVSLHIPPLRERREDIPLLVRHFLGRFSAKHGRPGLVPTAGLLSRLNAYSWPGNVRELENTMERLVIFSSGSTITEEDLELAGIPGKAPAEAKETRKAPPESMLTFELIPLEDVERDYVARVIREVGGNRTEAAAILGIDRKTLRLKLRRWGMEDM